MLHFQVVLDSDDPLFGGFGRIDHNAEFFTFVSKISLHYLCYLIFFQKEISIKNSILSMQEGWYDDRPSSFMVYAPSRTAVVYALVDKDQEVAVEE